DDSEEEDDKRDTELPPPATWAGRKGREHEEVESEPAEAADENTEDEGEIGSGITDEFSLDDEVPPEEAPAEEPPPVEEPPDPEAPEPIEEPHAPEAPPSGDETEFHPVAEEDLGDDEADFEPESDEHEPDSEELEAEGTEPESEELEAALEPESEELEAEPDSEELEAESEETGEREPVTAIAPGPSPKIPSSAGPKEKADKPPRAGLWPRFVAASLVIVISMATATAATVLLYFQGIADAIGENIPGVERLLEQVEGGEPQTVLILGSDIRPDIEEKGRSDTTMLLRLDAGKNVLSLLSLPRDLRVNIPGYGIGKLNEAYTVGGAKLTTKVVNQLTGLEINHVVNIDFTGFADAVNAIECVFVDVDRDYFISNEGIFDDSQKIAEIDIDAGYQQLCGLKALQYVRFRHDDNDLVRAARQQSFLREARAKVPPLELLKQRDEFIDIFTKYTTSDIDSAVAMIDVINLFIDLRDAPVRRIEFQGDIGGPDSAYVTASNEQIKAAVQQFLGTAPTASERAGEVAGNEDVDGGSGSGSGDGGSGKGGGSGDSGDGASPAANLIDASDAASRYALQFDGKLRFPVIAPVRLKPGSTYSDDSRAYTIDTYRGQHYPSYKMVFELSGPFGVPEYYGAMGTKWDKPPILETPSETRQIGDRNYSLYYEGDRLQVVGFKTPEGSYWISNTLTGGLSEDEMLGVAESMKPFSPQQ
ncbi:MAG: LCP family protein, partial [Solirubrobacterales bacterium]